MKTFFSSPLLLFVKNLVVSYPSSKSLSLFWNMGSFVAFSVVIQVVSGLLLVLYYVPSDVLAFWSVDYLTRETFFGFVLRTFHLNFASLIFISLYVHVARGLFFNSFRMYHVWNSGVSLLLLMMLTAFLGYVLPWGQMSFWGATVITNLLSTVPYFGPSLVLWVWGGYSINKASLNLFFLAHFLVPFIILVGILLHLLLLHETSSTNPLLVHEDQSKIKFTPYFTFKDLLNLSVIFSFFGMSLFAPWTLGDPENWITANPMVSPVHILPEWYFLFAYAILRAIPNKLGGVLALVLSVTIFYFLSLSSPYLPKKVKKNKIFLCIFISTFFLLTFFGSKPVESPYVEVSQLFTVVYFFSFLILL